jgi:RimJ/RimL family protein N-acetyltransferase
MKSKIIIETERLYLREMHPSDARDFWRLNRDFDVIKFTGDKPFSGIAEARRFIQSYDQYEKYGMGRWNVYLREDNGYIGFAGLKYWPERDLVDLGFRLLRAYWGKGLALEASRGCINYGFEELGLKEIQAWTMEQNRASTKLLFKLGFDNLGPEMREDGEWQRFRLLNSGD